MIKDTNGLFQQSIEPEINIIYDYLYRCAQDESPTEVIQKVKFLLVQGRNENTKVSQALEKIICSSIGQQQFDNIFSHCFYLILNSWSNTPESLVHINDLIEILEAVNQTSSYDRRRKQLIQLVKNYQQTKSYCQLKTVIDFLDPNASLNMTRSNAAATNEVYQSGNSINNSIINTYLPRYTYLYSYFSPQESDLAELKKYIENLQDSRQKNFEIQLSKHIIYRFRLKQVAKMKLMSKGMGKIITKVNNPTLLSERAFKIALQQYLGKVNGKSTILERSQRFIADSDLRNSYQVFKKDLHRFLVRGIKSRSDNYDFSSSLQAKLEEVFPQSNSKPVNNTLVLQTCRKLFSFLIVDTSDSVEPHQFANLIVDLGTAQVMMILIKIALICPESKPDLEKKISLVAAHYQLSTIQDIPWLFKSLEHLLMAFSIYFGNIDVSLGKSIISHS